jgi:hypothetical protein
VDLVKVGIHFRVWILSLVLLCSHAYTPCKLLLDTTADDAAPFAVKATAVRVAGLQRVDLGCVSDFSLAAAAVAAATGRSRRRRRRSNNLGGLRTRGRDAGAGIRCGHGIVTGGEYS